MYAVDLVERALSSLRRNSINRVSAQERYYAYRLRLGCGRHRIAIPESWRTSRWL